MVESPALGVGALPEGSRRRFDPDMAGADAFLSAWPNPALTDSPEAIRRLWARLSPDERKAAAAKAVDWRSKAKAGGLRSFSASRYLRDKAWQSLDVLKASQKAGVSAPREFVFEGSDAWKAWCAHRLRTEGLRTGYPVIQRREDGRRGWYFPTLWPPRDAAVGQGVADKRDEGLDEFAKASGL